jgi:hypothetical protein
LKIFAGILFLALCVSLYANMQQLFSTRRRKRMVWRLQQKLRLRDERSRIGRPTQKDITSDWVLVRAEGAKPIESSAVMQTWLLQPRRMLILTNQEDVWVAVTRAGKNVALHGSLKGMNIAAWGHSYNQACESFLRAAHHAQKTV